MRNVFIVLLLTFLVGCQARPKVEEESKEAEKMEEFEKSKPTITTMGLDSPIDYTVFSDVIKSSDLIVEGNLFWLTLRDGYTGSIEILEVLKGIYHEKKVDYIADPTINLIVYPINPIPGIWFLLKDGKGWRLSSTCPGAHLKEKDLVLKILENK